MGTAEKERGLRLPSENIYFSLWLCHLLICLLDVGSVRRGKEGEEESYAKGGRKIICVRLAAVYNSGDRDTIITVAVVVPPLSLARYRDRAEALEKTASFVCGCRDEEARKTVTQRGRMHCIHWDSLI